MELKELRKKSEKDLHKLLAEIREKLRVLRFKDANNQLKNIREVRKVRETIARILTLLNVREEKDGQKVEENKIVEEKKNN